MKQSTETENNYNITQLKKKLTKLEEENEILKRVSKINTDLFELVPTGLYRTTPDGRILNVNKAFCELLGFENKEEVINLNALDLYENPDHRKSLNEKVLAGESLADYDAVLKRKDGQRIWAKITAQTVRDNEGNVIFYEGNIRDISELKFANELLKESENRYQLVIEKAHEGIYIIQQRCFVFVNEAFSNMLGYKRNELIGRDFIDVLAPDQIELVNSRYRNRLKGIEQPKNYEIRLLHKAGTIITGMMSVDIIDYQGSPSTFGVIKDITEKKKIEDRLRENEALYKSLINAPDDVIYVLDTNGTFCDVNEAMLKITGKKREDIIGKHYSSIFEEQSFNITKTIIEKVKKEKKASRSESSRFDRTWDNSYNPIFTDAGEVDKIAVFSRDITDYIIIQNSLKETEAELNGVIASVPDVLWSNKIDENGKYLYAFYSPVIKNLTGKSYKYFAGNPDNFWNIVHQDDVDGIKAKYKKCMNELSEFHENFRIKRANNKFGWIRATVHFEKSDKKITNVYGLFTDITEQVETNLMNNALYDISEAVNTSADLNSLFKKIHSIVKQLMPADNFYISLYEEENDLISFPYYVDQYDEAPPPTKPGKGLTEYVIFKGKDILVNKEMDEKLRKSGDVELVGEPQAIWMGICLKLENNSIGAMVLQDYENEKAYGEREKKILIFVSEQIAAAIERVRTAEKLRRSERGYRAIYENAHDGIIIFDPHKRVILDANLQAAVLYGFNLEILKSVRLEAIIQNDVLKKMMKSLVSEAGKIVSVESTFEQNGREKIFIESNLSRINYNGVDAVLAIQRNITGRKKIENELKEYIEKLELTTKQLEDNSRRLQNLNKQLEESREELKILNSQKDVFFSIIAHDLKSPFTSLLGFTQYLIQEYDSLSKEEIREFTFNIDKSARHVYNLLENLLQWSRIKTGRMEFAQVKIDIHDIASEVINLYQPNAMRKKIKLINSVPSKIVAFADNYMINTVFRNLIANAIKFTNANGSITVSAERQGNNVEIKILDTGVGIAEEDIEKLFKIDEHYTTIGTENEKGTGLGLILCKEFIEKNSGTIRVESELNSGTTFIITLPAPVK